jgi:DNA polymerase alpha subunit A
MSKSPSSLATKKAKAPKTTKSDRTKVSKPKEEPHVHVSATTSAYRRVVAPEKEADFMSSIFSALDANMDLPQPKTTRPQQWRKRKSSPVLDTSSDFETHAMDLGPGSGSNWISHGNSEPSSDAIIGRSPTRQSKRARVQIDTDIQVAREVSMLKVEASENDDEFDDIEPMDLGVLDDMNVDEPPVQAKLEPVKPTYSRPAETAKKDEKATPAWLELHSKLLSNSLSADVEDTLGNSNSTIPGSTMVDALEEDGSLHFFWLDYIEIDGRLYFTGKVLNKGASEKENKYVSCCVKVEGIERNLYIMPRDKRVGASSEPWNLFR